MNTDLDNLSSLFLTHCGVNGSLDILSISLDTIKKVNLSQISENYFCCSLPFSLQDFISNYFKLFIEGDEISINSNDIKESRFSECISAYLKCIEKSFFDFCLLKGLSFNDYRLEQSINVIPNFTEHRYIYTQSMYPFYIYSFIGDDSISFFSDLESRTEVTVGNSVPVIVPHTLDYFLKPKVDTLAILVKVKGL